MNNKLKLQELCESNLEEHKALLTSIVLASERVGSEWKDFTSYVVDIKQEFRFMTIEDIQKAIRSGSLGKYGRTYKFTIQEVCFWVREYLKEKNKGGKAV
jgi:hypothetical protein